MTTLKAQRAAQVLANRKTAFAKRLATLTGHVAGRVSQKEIDHAVAEGWSADQFAAVIAAQEPVGAALHTQKTEAIKAAAIDAATTIGSIQLRLEQAGWDINAVAPHAGSVWDHDYREKRARRNFVESLTADVKDGYHRYAKGEPRIVRMSDEGIERFIRHAEEDAALQYDAFICKMVRKIGEGAVDAEIEGNHIWSWSILVVTLADGTTERWKTQQIWNTSIHGLRFPQWPSRKLK